MINILTKTEVNTVVGAALCFCRNGYRERWEMYRRKIVSSECKVLCCVVSYTGVGWEWHDGESYAAGICRGRNIKPIYADTNLFGTRFSYSR